MSEDIGAGIYVSSYENVSYADVDDVRVQFMEDMNVYITTNSKSADWIKNGYLFRLKYENNETDFPMQSFQAFAERLVKEIIVTRTLE